MKIALLYSGGLDSFLMYNWAKFKYPDAEITCVFYAHGQDSVEAELMVLPDFVEVRRLDWLDETHQPVAKKSDPFAGNIYIPGRNLIFGALIASQELADEVWMGTVVDEDNEQATDKNTKFRTETSNLLSYVLSPFIDNVQIRFPFVEEKMTKEDCVRWALENGISGDDIVNTTSCWHNFDGTPCGECKQCLKRMLVFELNSLSEDYKIHPIESDVQQKLIYDYLDAYLRHLLGVDAINEDEINVADMIIRWMKNVNTLPESDMIADIKTLLIQINQIKEITK
jgi:7-cyano-7-deazaguanine synthase in queuosine biosynthesis